jgi:hypothetical protein
VLRTAIATALEEAPPSKKLEWQDLLDAVDAGHVVRFKVRREHLPVLTPGLFGEVESAFTPD